MMRAMGRLARTAALAPLLGLLLSRVSATTARFSFP
jgi:hypothetical protein